MNPCKRLFPLLSAALLVFARPSSLNADPFVFDFLGASGFDAVTVNYFNLGPGNSLAQGAVPFTSGNTFQLLFQARLNLFTTNISIFPFEITILGSVTEKVTSVNAGPPSRLTFELAQSQALASFLEIYYDTAQDADDLTGTGFNNGTLILRGSPVPTLSNVGTFCLADPQPSTAQFLDQFGTNNFGGVTSVVGAGGTRINVVVTFIDRRFFPVQQLGVTGRTVQVGDIVTVDIGHVTPFTGSDPSRAFTGTSNPGTGATPAPDVTPALGGANGSAGTDLETQSTVGFYIGPSPSPTPTPSTTPTPIPGVPKVVISASRTQIREGADSIITFSVNQPHPDLTVLYSHGGSATLNVDYTLTDMNGVAVAADVVAIPSGQNSVSIVLHSVLDIIREPNGEPVKLTLLPGTGYQVPANKDANRVVVLILDRNG